MAMSNETIINLVENVGIKKIPDNKLMSAYSFIMKKAMTGSCSACAKRKAMTAILRRYQELKAEQKEEENEAK